MSGAASRVRSDERDGRLILEWRWLRAVHLLTPALIAFFVAVVWWRMARTPTAWGVTAVALPFSYVALARLCNRARIVAGDDGVTVTHGPLPWPGVRVGRAQLARIVAESRHGRRGGVRHSLVAVGADGRRRRLVSDLRDADEARALVTALTQRLRLETGAEPAVETPRLAPGNGIMK